jgi:cytochrome bd-type quinol oxidase subunit 1
MFSGVIPSYGAPSTTSAPAGNGASVIQQEAGIDKAPVLKAEDYPKARGVNARLAVWLGAQMHLWFAAFVLAVPIFVLIIELAGVVKKDSRLDALAYEFIRVSVTAYSLTAVTGGLFLASLIVFYPAVLKYLVYVFKPTMLVYVALFFVESAALYVYYYGWHSMTGGFLKKLHLFTGFILILAGTAIMFIANAWVTFMMSPAGVDKYGALTGGVWQAVNNPLWNPMNLHRFVANIAYGASIVGAYAAYKFLSARSHDEKAHYDWMGHTASFISIASLLPLPFAGYWLTAEIYRYSQQMGITLMGGAFGWLFIIQAVLIGALFLSANYYLWCAMSRGGAVKYRGWIKYIACALFFSFLVWFTPHTLTLSAEEAASGGQYHSILGPLGLMPAKNTAVNIMIIFTYLTFLLYRRSSRSARATPSVNALQAALFSAGVVNIIFLGAYYGYFTDTAYKVASSVAQVLTTLIVICASAVIEHFAFSGEKGKKTVEWGNMPARSQYALILIAVSFTWLMGLMGYVRSAVRQHWHVFTIMKDASADAFTPPIAYAAKVTSIGTIIFMALVVIIFWLSEFRGKKHE